MESRFFMDSKTIENFLKAIIEIDEKTSEDVEAINHEIENRESQLKRIVMDINSNSEALKLSQAKTMLERIQSETDAEIERINSECQAYMTEMERKFEEKKQQMIQKALDKLAMEKWGATCTK